VLPRLLKRSPGDSASKQTPHSHMQTDVIDAGLPGHIFGLEVGNVVDATVASQCKYPECNSSSPGAFAQCKRDDGVHRLFFINVPILQFVYEAQSQWQS
jgi:hypothetical protein